MKFLFISIISIILLYLTCSYGASFKRDQIFPYEELFEDNGKLVIFGSIKPGTPVLLLNESSAGPCLGETTGLGSYYFPINDEHIKYTNFKVINNCSNNKFFGVLVGVKNATYKYFKLTKTDDEKVANKILSFAGENVPKEDDDHFKFLKTLPTLWSIPNQKSIQYVAQIKRVVTPEGPIFMYKDDNIFLFEGECATEIKLFSVNNCMYLRYIEFGCMSGVHVIRVYNLSQEKPSLVYTNSTWDS